ncbi:unnamed protein product [Leptidea sinapis]|uniref:Uncharacterized protein n=1 Tax=Leptidea sinapis TaxID=189913 RepID=A0A5E4R252_9NEOP|nr:unnamed protein product [Leptidea sinapis]
MEDAFKKLQNNGNNSVDNLVNWMKDCVPDAKNVEYSKFVEILNTLATENKRNVDDLMKTLSDVGPKLMNAATAAVGAVKDALALK